MKTPLSRRGSVVLRPLTLAIISAAFAVPAFGIDPPASTGNAQPAPATARSILLKQNSAREIEAPPVVNGPLTLSEAASLAQRHSPAVRLAEEGLARAGGALREARGAAGPSFGITGAYTRFDKVEQIEIAPGQSVALGEIDQKSARATVSQIIDISGVAGASIDAARYRRLAAELDLETARERVALAAREAYLGVLRAREAEQVALQAVERDQELLRLAQVRLTAGAAPRFDVLRAETELANDEQNLITARNGARVAEAALANVMGVVLPQQAELARPAVTDRQVPPLPDITRKALADRPEALSSEATVLAAERGVHIARRGLRPGLSLDANYNWNGNTTLFQPRKFTADAMVAVSLPIFDSGITRGRVEQAEADVESARALRSQTALDITLEVEQAYASLENSRKLQQVAETALEQAQEALRLARVRYENEVGTVVEITDAQLALTQAQTNAVTARYDLLLAFARLARAAGDPALAMD